MQETRDPFSYRKKESKFQVYGVRCLFEVCERGIIYLLREAVTSNLALWVFHVDDEY